jgi:hypothetical protein
MKRVSLSNAIKRAEGTLTAIHPDEMAKRRRAMMQIAELRLLRERLDHLGGIVEAFEHNGQLFVRQYIMRSLKIYWHKAVQADLHLIDDATHIEDYYNEYYSTMG